VTLTSGFLFFWGRQDVYSNWYPSRFVIAGVEYVNVEQYLMAAKARIFKDFETEAKILKTSDPRSLKALGREVKGFIEDVWVSVREKVMFDGCLAKFSQNEPLKATILDTGELRIVEASPSDRIWGIGLAAEDPRALDPAQWRGLNLLGEALMRVRARLRASPDAVPTGQLPLV
jgi:ribA/ribD-fused uncharacterized protein